MRDLPPKGTLARPVVEFTIRWRQLGRVIAKEAPFLGLMGRAFARLPPIRDLYDWYDKTLGRRQ